MLYLTTHLTHIICGYMASEDRMKYYSCYVLLIVLKMEIRGLGYYFLQDVRFVRR